MIEPSLVSILERSSRKSPESLGMDEGLIAYWRELSVDHRFHEVLSYCLSDLGPYALENGCNPIPHVQSEHVGGLKGILYLTNRLLTGYSSAVMRKKKLHSFDD